jgi:hypothetical protein
VQVYQQEQVRKIQSSEHINLNDQLAELELESIGRDRESVNGSINEEHALFLKRQRTRLISLATRTAMARANPGSRMFGLILMATWQRLARDAGLYGDGEEQSSDGANEFQSSNGSTETAAPKPFPWPFCKS